MKFFGFLILMMIFSILNAAAILVWQDETGITPELTYNSKSLVRPSDMTLVQWIDALEIERDKADYLGKFESFEDFTKEISTILGGKYGVLETSPAKLIYSVMRTRHKFPGKRNMFTDFYGILPSFDLLSLASLASILAIDTMAAKAMNSEDEAFENQWAVVNIETPATLKFIDAVKQYAQMREKSLFTALDEHLTHFLMVDHSVIALAKQVVDIFSPKLTLNKIYGDMAVGSQYKGWTAHGAIAYPIVFTVEEKTNYGWLETALNKKAFELMVKGVPVDVYCRSAMADLSSEIMISQLGLTPNTVLLSYVYDPAASELVPGLVGGVGVLRLFFTREVNPELIETLRRPYAKIPETEISRIYTATMKEAQKRTPQQVSSEEVAFLKKIGNPVMLKHISAWHYEAKHGFKASMPLAIEFCRKAAELGNKEAEHNLPIMLFRYATCLYNGKFVTKNVLQAIELYKEAAGFGHEESIKILAEMPEAIS